ncbi:UDP-2,4-diacetamido-2,4,6-trideoxy-beta-L-altropyranose hydrolase [Nautilia lithotrophica]
MIILRVDFSPDIGFGHLKRATLFCNKLKNKYEKCLILCKECNEKYTDIPVIKIKSEDEFFTQIKKLQPEKVIVDNYNFTYEYEKKFKTLFPNISLICVDDNFEKHYCDEIINTNLYAKKEKYQNKVPTFTKITILKPLIRDEFKKAKKKRYKKEGLFISFGGTDAKGLTLKVLKILKNKKLNVNVYTTSANQNLNKLKRFCRINKWCKLHIDKNVAEGMAKAKFGIITPSTITWEAVYMNMPFLAVKVADNQKFIAKYLKEKRVKVISEREIQKISRIIF